MSKAIHILLLIDTHAACFRRCIQGIATFARTQADWVLHTAEPGMDWRACVKACRPDAVIAVYDPALAAHLSRLKIPASYVYGDAGGCSGIDNLELGRMAARHLLGLGLRHFAFYGFDWSSLRERLAGFKAELERAGHPLGDIYWPHVKQNGMWPLHNPGLERWLHKQPTPLGLFAAGDLLAFEVVQLCRNRGLRVPEQIAVLGTDNDEMLCAIASPELSSIKTPDELVGHSGAQCLGRLLANKSSRAPLPAAVLFPPHGVAARRSTDVLLLKDDDLAAALAFIRQNAEKPIGVSDVLEKVGISRRLLEHKFKSTLQRTPLEEIRRVRIERAKTLLLDGSISIAAIARATGFDSADWLSEVFRRETGMTPSNYRKRFSLPGSSKNQQ